MSFIQMDSGIYVPKNRILSLNKSLNRNKNLVINSTKGGGKFGNKRTVYDDIIFDSFAEREYYRMLKSTMKDLSLVTFQEVFELQPKYDLNGKTYRRISYKPDFVIRNRSGDIKKVVDVKGFETDIFKIKGKMFSYKYNTPLILAKYDHRSKVFKEVQF